MSMTDAQNQKQIDDGAEFDGLMDDIRAEMREELTADRYIVLRYRENGKVKPDGLDFDNVIDAMIDVSPDEFNAAIGLTLKSPEDGSKALAALVPGAVEEVIRKAKVREEAEYRMELMKRDAA